MSVTINGTTGITTPDVTTDDLTVDTNTLYVDATNNRVGIGTSSPTANLHIQKTGADAGITIEETSITGYSQYLQLKDSTTSWYVVNRYAGSGSGNTGFGIGTTNSGDDLQIDTSGNLYFNSGYGSAGKAYGCRAWVNFNGTGTVAIRGSQNVSSITDRGVGQHTINFSTAMPDVNYNFTAGGPGDNGNPFVTGNDGGYNTASLPISTCRAGLSGFQDSAYTNVSIHR